ncbi:Mbov_0399 family ICE element protein [Mycoplasma feriruminatoris]|uniref:Uncharacterized protein n=1 Tax=Mycoplasma feriruminatoris TaxID=1179777 RepID=A0AAX3TH65_9MOLU|nr:hypothetical protein [Mycoplasma feriruminatoris]WFQ93055.1 hypothetical protein MFERI14822_00848 [Mycoplasma feriruminatoris]
MKKALIISSFSLLPFFVGGLVNHSSNIIKNSQWLVLKSVTPNTFSNEDEKDIVEYKTEELIKNNIPDYIHLQKEPRTIREYIDGHWESIKAYPYIQFTGQRPPEFPQGWFAGYPYLDYYKGLKKEITSPQIDDLINKLSDLGVYKSTNESDSGGVWESKDNDPLNLKKEFETKAQGKEVVEIKAILEYEDTFYRKNSSNSTVEYYGDRIAPLINLKLHKIIPLTNLKLQITYKESRTNPLAKYKASWEKWVEHFNNVNHIKVYSDTGGDLSTSLSNNFEDLDFKTNKQILDEEIQKLNSELHNDLTLSYKQVNNNMISLFLSSNSDEFKDRLFIDKMPLTFPKSDKQKQREITQQADKRLKITLGKWVDFETDTTKLVDDKLVRDTSVPLVNSGVNRNGGRWIAHTPLSVSFSAIEDESEILKINGERVDVLNKRFEKTLTDDRTDVNDKERVLNGDEPRPTDDKPKELNEKNSHAKNEYKIEITKFKDTANKDVEYTWTRTIVIDSKSSQMDFKWYAWNPGNDPKQKELIEQFLKDKEGNIVKDKNGVNIPNPKYDPKIDPTTGTKKQLVWLDFKNMHYPQPNNEYSRKTNLPDNFKTLFKPHEAHNLDSGAIAEAVVINKGALRSITQGIKDYTVYKLDPTTGTYDKQFYKNDKLAKLTTENTYFSSEGLWLFASAADKTIANFKLVYIVKDNVLDKDKYLTTMLPNTNKIIRPLWNTQQGREFYNYLISNKLGDKEIQKLNYEAAMEHYKAYINALYNNYTFNSTYFISPKFKNLDNKFTTGEFLSTYSSNLKKFKNDWLDDFENKDKVDISKIEVRPDKAGIYVWFKLNTFEANYKLSQDKYSVDVRFKDYNSSSSPNRNPGDSSNPGSSDSSRNGNTPGSSSGGSSNGNRDNSRSGGSGGSGGSSGNNNNSQPGTTNPTNSTTTKKSINLYLNSEYLYLLAKSSYKKEFLSKLDTKEIFKNTKDEIAKLDIHTEFSHTFNSLTINVNLKPEYSSIYKIEPQNTFKVHLTDFLTNSETIREEAIERIPLKDVFKHTDLGHFKQKLDSISIYSGIIDKLFQLNKNEMNNFYNTYNTYPKLKTTDFGLGTVKKINVNNKTKYFAIVYLDYGFLEKTKSGLETLKHYYGTVEITFSTEDEYKEAPISPTPSNRPNGDNSSSSPNRNPGDSSNPGSSDSSRNGNTPGSSSGGSSNGNRDNSRSGGSGGSGGSSGNNNNSQPGSSSQPSDEINNRAINDRPAIIDDDKNNSNGNNSSTDNNGSSNKPNRPFNPLNPNQPVDDETTNNNNGDETSDINKDIFSELKLKSLNLNGIDNEEEAKKYIIDKLKEELPNLKLDTDYKISNLDSVVSELKYPQVNVSSPYIIRSQQLVLEAILPRFGYATIQITNTVNKIINTNYDLKTKKLNDIQVNENKLSVLKTKIIDEINKQFKLEKFEVNKDIQITNFDTGIQLLVKGNNTEYEFIIKGLNYKIKNQTSVKVKNIAKFVVDDKSPEYKPGDENNQDKAILYDLSNIKLRLYYKEHVMSELREMILDEISREISMRYSLVYDKDYTINIDELNAVVRGLTVKNDNETSKVLRLLPIKKVSKNYALINIKNYNKLFNPVDDLYKPIRRVEERLRAEKRKKLLLIFIPLSILAATGIGLLAWFIYIRKVKNKIT